MTSRVVYELISRVGGFTGSSGIFVCRGLGRDNGGNTERPRSEHDR